MSEQIGTVPTLLEILLMHFILPAAMTFGFYLLLRKMGWIKDGDLRLNAID